MHWVRLLLVSALAILFACKTSAAAQQNQTPLHLPSAVGQNRSDAKPTKTPSLQQKALTTQSTTYPTRSALVIGNSEYTDLPKLTNPTNDARAIVDVLRDLGFDVTLVTNASETNLRRAIRKFADQSSKAELALIYYAGHGAQINGENYLLPVDMEIPQTETDVELSSLKVDDLVNSVRSTTKVVFLDACRDNPALFKNLVKGRGASATGLAPTNALHLTRVKSGGGVFIAYATDAGSVALEGDGQHSPFTTALLRNLKKPISIDDMFSLVTREVSLVTKGMQRPYKYASLENIICLAGSCSGGPPQPAVDIVQEARRSESDELQIARQTKNPNALQSFLEKYPESLERQKVLAEIAHLKRSEFDGWTLFQLTKNNRSPEYLKISSIRQFGDRVAVQTRSLIDATVPILGTKKFPDGTYGEIVSVLDCKQSTFALSEVKAVSPSGKILASYKWADPEYLGLSVGAAIESHMVAATAKPILCDERLRTSMVGKKQLASMNFTLLSSTADGSGELYYQTIINKGEAQAEKDAIVLNQEANIHKLSDAVLAPGVTTAVELGSYKTRVQWVRLKCDVRRASVLKMELYDELENLVFLVVGNKEQLFSETSPMAVLQRILCAPQEVQQ